MDFGSCETLISNLFIIFRGGAQDSELRAAGFGFGRFTGVEEGLDERLQMLPFLTEKAQDTICISYNGSIISLTGVCAIEKC